MPTVERTPLDVATSARLKAARAADAYHQTVRALSAADLRAHAKTAGIVGASSKRKAELLDALGVPDPV